MTAASSYTFNMGTKSFNRIYFEPRSIMFIYTVFYIYLHIVTCSKSERTISHDWWIERWKPSNFVFANNFDHNFVQRLKRESSSSTGNFAKDWRSRAAERNAQEGSKEKVPELQKQHRDDRSTEDSKAGEENEISPSPSNVYTYGESKKGHDTSSSNSYGGGSVPASVYSYGGGPPSGAHRDESKKEHQIITSVPDLSDPCFRRYANSIIVNAQPYERRSSISLVNCKTQCLRSQIGVYSCRSFVYDNVNQVCDLFAHVGDQAPARLLRFQTRDYFEPTAAISCVPPPDPPTVPTSMEVQSPASQTTQAQLKGSQTLGSERSGSGVLLPHIPQRESPSAVAPASANSLGAELPPGSAEMSCNPDQVPRFLKTVDFELHDHDDMRIESISLEECIELCSNNAMSRDNGTSHQIKCNSFEYTANECILSTETAVPLGNGQLKQKQGTDYYEKLCVDRKLANECATPVYNRHPQMILVGFAETVVDAPSLQHCFDNCLNSKALYGFQCSSGMFYFEEPQLNCILNTEDRSTQPDLFTGENSDLVDYFETGGCKTQNTYRRYAPQSNSLDNNFYRNRKDFVDPIPTPIKTRHESPASGNKRRSAPNVSSLGIWSEWSPCVRPEGNIDGAEGMQSRKKICDGERVCGRESRACDMLARPLSPEASMDKVVDTLRRLKCPVDECCPVFGGCKVGVIQKSGSHRLEWCLEPCKHL